MRKTSGGAHKTERLEGDADKAEWDEMVRIVEEDSQFEDAKERDDFVPELVQVLCIENRSDFF